MDHRIKVDQSAQVSLPLRVRQDGAVLGQIGAKSVWPSENQGKSREINPPREHFFPGASVGGHD
jgi:hypothetical protein